MGKTFTNVKLWNILDEERIKNGILNPIEIKAQVDNGATTVVLSKKLAEELKLIKIGKSRVKYADGRKKTHDKVTGLRIEIMNRNTICDAIIEPNIQMPLIGQFVLEILDLWIDSKHGRLIPNPESPDMPLLEIL